MFNEKPPMLGGDVQTDLAALRDYLFRMVRGLEDVTTAAGSGNVVSYGPKSQQGGASKSDIDKVRQNAEELKALIIKSANNLQQEIDDIEAINFFVKYADDFSGTYPSTMYNTPTSTTAYMGTCSSASTTAPTDPSVYSWAKIKGDTGAQGIQGPAGTNGQTTYLHIKYSDDGVNFTLNPTTGQRDGETLGAFIGMYTDFTQADSMTFSDYEWHRFSDDTELKSMITDTSSSIINYVDSKVSEYNSLYVAKSDFGTYTETINSTIEATARGVVDSYNYSSAIESMQDSIGLIQNYFTNVAGEIRRGIVLDPTTNQYVTGIAISQDLKFAGECGPSDQNNPGDGYTYYYLTSGQTFGLYTSTGWQFWIDGHKTGWFDSEDGMLHVAKVYIEEKLVMSGYWELKETTNSIYHLFELNYIGG